ncbi:MAG: DUF530 domain-containing protein [Methanomicrobiales archaeon]
MNESVLIGDAEKFLDEIKRNELNTDDLVDLESFSQSYNLLTKNLGKLQEFKEVMELKGYKAPYRSLARLGPHTAGEIQIEDIQDVTRHNQYFRMKAAAKKNILDRINSAISSHRIAIGHLEEYAVINCRSCGKKYKGHEISLILNHPFRCECGSIDLDLEINQIGVYRLRVLKYLPLSGDYMVKMSDLSLLGRDAYKKIMNILKHEKRGAIKTVSLVIRVLEDDRWIRKRVSLDADDGENYEKELQKKYGSNVRIEFLQFHRKKPAILNDKHTRTSISLAYVKYAEDSIKKIFDKILLNHLNNLEKVKIYDESKDLTNNLTDDNLTEDELKLLKKQRLRHILLEQGLINSDDSIDLELGKDLERRKNLKNKLFIEIPRVLVLWDIGKYYLTTSYDRRIKYSGPFPYLRPNLDRNQLKAFEDFDEDVVNVLRKYLEEEIVMINNFSEVLAEKFKMEKHTKGIHLRTNPVAFGAAVLKLKNELDIETAAKVFSVSPKEVSDEIKVLETFGKPTSKKARKFLEIIKK